MKAGLLLTVTMVLGLAAGAILTGCDSAEGIDGLQLAPSSATINLSSSNRVLAISALIQSDLALPLKWSVSAPSLGSLSSSSSNAVYTARAGATGNQVVSAKDQYGNEGFCSIIQVE